MSVFRPKRALFWIAIAAIAIAILALLVPHYGNTADQQAWLAMLPVFLVGLLARVSIKPLLAFLSLGHTPKSPALAPSFQRPPPRLA